MKKLFLRAEFGPLWEPWEEDEIGRKHSYWSKIFFGPMKMFSCPPSINKNIVLNKEVTNFVTNHVTYFCDRLTKLALCAPAVLGTKALQDAPAPANSNF